MVSILGPIRKGWKLVENFSGSHCSGCSMSLAGDTGQIEKAIFDSGSFQTSALGQNFLGSVSFFHKCKGAVIPGFHTNG